MARARRRRSVDARSLALVALLAVAGLAGLGLLASSLGWIGGGSSGPRVAPAGTIAVPAAGVTIPTYARVRVDHLVDPRTGDLRAVYLPEGSILPETFVDAREIVGRVLAVDKEPGQVFSENDFFPPGTREGIVAGIPAGKRAMRIDARKVGGIVGLGRGDRFDLIATLDVAKTAGRGVQVQGAGGRSMGRLGSPVRATTIVAAGAVVQPLERRMVPGRTAQVVEEMVIAVAPDEVGALTEALHAGARVDCVPLSGQPSELAGEPGGDASSRGGGALRMVETIVGGKRSIIAVHSDDHAHGRSADRSDAAPPAVSAAPPRSDLSGQAER